MASIDGGTANGIVAVDMLSTDTGPRGGLALRVADAGNYLVLRYAGEFGSGRVELLRRVNGAFSLVASAGVVPLDAASHRLEARMNGLGIGAYWDGRALFQMDVNDNATATRHGLFWNANQDATATFDNFKITTEAFTPALSTNTVCEALLSRWYIEMTSANGNPTVDVSIPAGCTWTARMIAGNATMTSGGPVTGPGTVQFNVNYNQTSEPMIAYASIAGQLVVIHQKGVGGQACNYVVSPVGLGFQTDGDTATVIVTPMYPGARGPPPRIAAGSRSTMGRCALVRGALPSRSTRTTEERIGTGRSSSPRGNCPSSRTTSSARSRRTVRSRTSRLRRPRSMCGSTHRRTVAGTQSV
jgi:hypothetical protein